MISTRVNALAHLDTATRAPASGPATSPHPAPETPGRRPALRPPVTLLVAVSRCALKARHGLVRENFMAAARRLPPANRDATAGCCPSIAATASLSMIE